VLEPIEAWAADIPAMLENGLMYRNEIPRRLVPSEAQDGHSGVSAAALRIVHERVEAELANTSSQFLVRAPSKVVRYGGVFYFVGPTEELLLRYAKAAVARANEGARIHRAPVPVVRKVFASAFGVLCHAPFVGEWIRNTGVLLAWYTVHRIRVVRLETIRSPFWEGDLAHWKDGGRRSAFQAVFPHRRALAVRRRAEHTRRLIERFGPSGDDDRLSIIQPVIRAYAPGFGAIISDDRKRPMIAQVVVRDSTTGQRHAIAVPPRFANPQSATFQRLVTPRARVHAAVAWSFGLKPEEYVPQIET
jgi:hypothetical protein